MPNNFSNIVDAATDMLESLTDNHKAPLHVGEVMTSWTYLSFTSGIVSYAEIGLNTVTDPELKSFIEGTLAVVKRHKKEMAEFMRTEGVPLPSMPEEKPKSDPTAVPMGAIQMMKLSIHWLSILFMQPILVRLRQVNAFEQILPPFFSNSRSINYLSQFKQEK